MSDYWFKLLGAPVGGTGDIVDWQFQFHPALAWGTCLLLVALAASIALWSYWRSGVSLSTGRLRCLAALRLLALAGIAVVLLRPSLGLVVEGVVRQSLVLLFDESASLALRDPRTSAADQVRAGIAEGALPAAAGLQQQPPAPKRVRASRLELLRASLTNRELALIERLGRGFTLKTAGFAGEVLPLVVPGLSGPPSPSASTPVANRPAADGTSIAAGLRAEGRETAPGTALREILERERGRPLGGVVLFTDGIRNAGIDPREAAAIAREAGVAIHCVGLGTTAPRDLQVADLGVPEVAFVRDEVPIAIRLRARGLTGEVARVILSVEGTPVETREVRIESDGDITLDLKLTPEITGNFEVAVEAPARADEILAENNRLVRRMRVMDDRIRVLLLEQSPRWEFRYLQALLLRDRRVELKCVLFDGDPAITRSPGTPYLDAFPARREDLFAYDLVVFGDVDPRNLTPAQLELLAEFVSRSGGSFLMLAGRRFSPWSYRDTALERLLPVEFPRGIAESATTGVHDQPAKLLLTAEGRSSPLLRLAEKPDENLRRWEALAPLYWIAPVLRAKPAAQSLVVQAKGDDPNAAIPVIALQQYGVGQSMFIGTDNTWRWRRNEGEQFFVAFWGRIVQRLAIQHLLSGSRRTQIALDRSSALPGERIGITARVFNNSFEPVVDPSVGARLESAVRNTNSSPSTISELLLRAVPDQPGVFQGELLAGRPGRYRLTVGEDSPATADLTIDDRLIEAGETALQEDPLRQLATSTGGSFFREEDLHRLPEAVQGHAQRVRSRVSIDLWSSPLWFLAILVALTFEWVLRKFWQLK